ncbi:MAG TPA: hypothetical protein P5277_00660 [Candidatus Paceibacterota bacterium]|nr:hypothetical protein [Candidatus Paceibacterota bacterium]
MTDKDQNYFREYINFDKVKAEGPTIRTYIRNKLFQILSEEKYPDEFLAKKLGTTVEDVRKYKSGELPITKDQLKRLFWLDSKNLSVNIFIPVKEITYGDVCIIEGLPRYSGETEKCGIWGGKGRPTQEQIDNGRRYATSVLISLQLLDYLDRNPDIDF